MQLPDSNSASSKENRGRFFHQISKNSIDVMCVTFLSKIDRTRQSKQCGFIIYTFDNLNSKSMVILVRAEKMVLSVLVFARKIARMILIQNV